MPCPNNCPIYNDYIYFLVSENKEEEFNEEPFYFVIYYKFFKEQLSLISLYYFPNRSGRFM